MSPFRRRRKGSAVIEAALWIPMLVLFLMGMVELSRVTYTYYTLHKILYNVARTAGTSQGINFCAEDGSVDALKQYALRGGVNDNGTTLLPNLEIGQIELRVERFDQEGQVVECDCSSSGCDTTGGGVNPDFIAVSIPDGYPVTLNIPTLTLDPILLRARVRVPFGGS